MDKRLRWMLGGITAAALLVRLWNLGGMGLWTDEAYSFHVAVRPTLAAVLSDHDQTPPLFVILLHFWMMLAGHSAAAVRMLSVICGVLTVPAVHAVAKRFTTPRGALLAAGLAALDVQFLVLSQEARAFALLLFLSTASFLALLRWMERPTLGRAAVYVVASAAMLYSHLWGAFFLLAQNAYVVAAKPPTPLGRWWGPRWLGSQAAIGALFLPWLPSLAQALGRVGTGFWIEAPGWDDVVATFFDLADGPLVALAIPLLAWFAVRRRAALRGDALLGWWIAVPVVVPFALSFWHPFYTPKYVVAAAVPVLILMAKAIDIALPEPRRFARAVVATGAVAALVVAGYFAYDFQLDGRQDWPSTMAVVEGHATPGAVVLFNKGYCDSASDRDLACSWELTQSRTDLRLVPFFFEDKGVSPPVNATNVKLLDPIAANATQVWLVYSYPSDSGDFIAHELQGLGFHGNGTWHFQRIDLARFDR